MNKPHVRKHTRHFLNVADEVFSDNVNEVDDEKHLSEENEEIYNSDFGFENFSENLLLLHLPAQWPPPGH